MFYDVTEGTIAVPCLNGTRDCAVTSPNNPFGILSGYTSGAGYDLATGIGSVNANNLVLGWNSVAGTFAESTTTLSAAGSSTASYGSSLDVNVTVAPAGSGSGTPSGDVGLTTDSTLPNNRSAGSGTLSNGSATLPAQFLQGGTYHLFAHYNGDAAFAPSDSTGLSITITPVVVTGATSVSTRSTMTPGQKATVSFSIPGIEYGEYPTGNVTFTNTATGKVLGTVSLTPASSTDSIPSSSALISVTSDQLQSGANQIHISYAGDWNYASLATTGPSILLASTFAVAAAPTSLTFAPDATGSATITVTPNGGNTIDPGSIALSCPADLSAFSCTFTAPVAGTGGAVQSTLTLQFHQPAPSPQAKKIASAAAGRSAQMLAAGAFGLGLFGCFSVRRRRFLAFLAGILPLVVMLTIQGCGGGHSSSNPTPPEAVATVTSLTATPATAAWNTPVALTAKVSATGTGVPTGSVTFASGNTVLGTANLSAGTAALTSSSLAVGNQAITASYAGDFSFKASSSPATTVDISYTTVVTVTAKDKSGNTSTADLPVTVQ